MKESRTYRIAWRRFDRAALQHIGELFVEQAARDRGKDWKNHLDLQVSCDDGTTYESDGLDLLAENSEAMLKNPLAVSFDFHALDLTGVGQRTETFTFELRQDDYSRLRVEGSEAAWVQSVFTRAKERIDACPPSDSWFTRHSAITDLAAVFGLGSIAFFVLVALFVAVVTVFGWPPPSVAISRPVAVGINWVGRFFLGGLVWGRLQSSFWAAWPKVELAFGPRHLRLAEQRRKTFAYVATAVVIPLLLAIGYDWWATRR